MCQRPSAVWITPLASPVPPADVRGWKLVVVLKVLMGGVGGVGGGGGLPPEH
jgi:hypothetical protein